MHGQIPVATVSLSVPRQPGRRKLANIRLRRQLIDDLRAGRSLTDAAAHAGVSLTTLHREMRRSSWFATAITRAREGGEAESEHVVSPHLFVPTTSPIRRRISITPVKPVDVVVPSAVLALQLGIAATLGNLAVTLAVGVVICLAVAVALSGALRTTGVRRRFEPTTEAVAIPVGDREARPRREERTARPSEREAPGGPRSGERRTELGWLRNTIGGPELPGPELADPRGRRR